MQDYIFHLQATAGCHYKWDGDSGCEDMGLGDVGLGDSGTWDSGTWSLGTWGPGTRGHGDAETLHNYIVMRSL